MTPPHHGFFRLILSNQRHLFSLPLLMTVPCSVSFPPAARHLTPSQPISCLRPPAPCCPLYSGKRHAVGLRHRGSLQKQLSAGRPFHCSQAFHSVCRFGYLISLLRRRRHFQRYISFSQPSLLLSCHRRKINGLVIWPIEHLMWFVQSLDSLRLRPFSLGVSQPQLSRCCRSGR